MLGKTYVMQCTAERPFHPKMACGKPAVTPCEKDGSAYCEWHRKEAKPENVLVLSAKKN